MYFASIIDNSVAYIQKDVELQHLYLGRSPPMFNEMRVLPHSNGDDHLVCEAD